MKTDFFKVGWRTGKTVIAVFLCFFIDTLRESGVPFYAAIAAIVCIQKNFKDSLKIAVTREIATIIGGVFGMAVLLFESEVYCVPNDLVRYAVLSVLLIPLINVSVLIQQKKGTFLMCVVFLCITATHKNDEHPFVFGINRIIDTTIGIAVALVINQFSNVIRKILEKRRAVHCSGFDGSASNKTNDLQEDKALLAKKDALQEEMDDTMHFE